MKLSACLHARSRPAKTRGIKVEKYTKQVPATIASYRGRYLMRGGAREVLEGDWVPDRLVILEFPSMVQLKDWYDSPEYAVAPAGTPATKTIKYIQPRPARWNSWPLPCYASGVKQTGQSKA